jgi:hypothetical protein
MGGEGAARLAAIMPRATSLESLSVDDTLTFNHVPPRHLRPCPPIPHHASPAPALIRQLTLHCWLPPSPLPPSAASYPATAARSPQAVHRDRVGGRRAARELGRRARRARQEGGAALAGALAGLARPLRALEFWWPGLPDAAADALAAAVARAGPLARLELGRVRLGPGRLAEAVGPAVRRSRATLEGLAVVDAAAGAGAGRREGGAQRVAGKSFSVLRGRAATRCSEGMQHVAAKACRILQVGLQSGAANVCNMLRRRPATCCREGLYHVAAWGGWHLPLPSFPP